MQFAGYEKGTVIIMKKHKKKETGEPKKKNFAGSLKSKVLVLVLGSIAAAVSLTLVFAIPFVTNTLTDTNMRYMSYLQMALLLTIRRKRKWGCQLRIRLF